MSGITRDEWHRVFKEEFFPSAFCPSKRVLIEKYDKEIKVILNALSEIDSNLGDALLTDQSRFSHLVLHDDKLKIAAKALGIKLKPSDKIVNIAKKI